LRSKHPITLVDNSRDVQVFVSIDTADDGCDLCGFGHAVILFCVSLNELRQKNARTGQS
jgi:hypothetical protein